MCPSSGGATPRSPTFSRLGVNPTPTHGSLVGIHRSHHWLNRAMVTKRKMKKEEEEQSQQEKHGQVLNPQTLSPEPCALSTRPRNLAVFFFNWIDNVRSNVTAPPRGLRTSKSFYRKRLHQVEDHLTNEKKSREATSFPGKDEPLIWQQHSNAMQFKFWVFTQIEPKLFKMITSHVTI